jgi:arylsulfatase A-like enzyme
VKHGFRVALLLSGFSMACIAACEPAPRDDRRDVVLVTVDTLRADHLSSYGFALPTSPRIDALAAESALFERAVAASSTTAPSHASILTARSVREHSVGHLNGETRLQGVPTLAEALREAGYGTGAFVSNFLLRRVLGFDRGFDHYDDALPDPEPNRPLIFERRAEATTARALAWLDETDGPVFLWVHYQDPHGPYDPPAGYRGSIERPAGLDPQEEEAPLPLLSTNTEFGGVPAYQILPGLTRPSEYRARYADEIRYVDHWIGELLERPRLRDAIFVLTADHGESLGESGHYFMHGTTTLPPEAHVPLLVRAPGIEPRRVPEIVSHLDVLPTILELVGVAPPPGVGGVALGPYLRGEGPLPVRVVYCDMGLQTSAYLSLSGRLVQVHNAGPASKGQPIARGYHWDGSRSLPTEGRGDPGFEKLRFELSAYLRRDRVAMSEVENLAPADLERLRALGYID